MIMVFTIGIGQRERADEKIETEEAVKKENKHSRSTIEKIGSH